MPSQIRMDNLYIDIASRLAEMSYARRSKVGVVVVKGENIISMGWNGTPKGHDNNCEIEKADGSLITKPEVIHAEQNAVRKLIESNTDGQLDGATFYSTLSPCLNCSDLIIRSKITRVVFRDAYRDLSGVDRLINNGVEIIQL